MTAAKPTNDPAPGRSRWRSALIRLLGGSTAPSPDHVQAPGPELLSLPRLDPPRLRSRAHHFFRYGEELARRGAPDLAAPFYRQAFTLLEASLGSPPPEPFSPPAGEREMSTVPAADGIALPSSGDGTSPTVDLAATVRRLRQALNRDTAESILGELAALQQQGVRHAEVHRLAGLAHLMRNDPRLAEADFRQALAIDPVHYGVLVNLAGVLLATGRHGEASGVLQQALQQVDPESLEAVPALANLSLAEDQQGRAIEAARLVLRVHRLQPGHIRNARLLQAAATLEEMGEDVEAIELLSWLRQRQPEPEVLRRLATLLERRGEYQEAALVYRELLGSSGTEASPSA